jgi:hypothetical protein
MGRSVSTLGNAVAVVYEDVSSFGQTIEYTCENDECENDEFLDENGTCEHCGHELTEKTSYDEWLGQFDFTEWVEYIQETIQDKYNSLECDDAWDDENHIILSNQFTEVAVSEYCGLASISVRCTDDEYIGLAERYTKYVGKFVEKTFGNLIKIGTFSNGESVYEAK